MQHLVPLEIVNANRTIVDEEHNEPAGEMRPRRQAAKNADTIRKLKDVQWWPTKSHVGGFL